MTLTESVRWLFGSASPGSAHADKLNASMDEFVQLLNTNGYDLKSLGTTEKAKKDAYPPEDVQ
ncbi:hypothetical protein [Tardiphaga robiniae]|uniref:Uncharacterized protein n=1 Tax=Tardiphaga robiniae TaxID=943830 RepID=A0A7G6TTY4_9BRAD|nr:hypothetical protein [Tardiphaga robiniae]QND70216.1 hypothetical protein HB776_02400 [Tardiphaga robiniae]